MSTALPLTLTYRHCPNMNKKKHPGHFEKVVYENIELAKKIADPVFQQATKLMAAEVVGMEDFEILLDPQLSVWKI